MATLTCTNCGQRGSDTDAFCTRCGMPRGGGRPAVPQASAAGGGGPRSGSNTLAWVAVAAAVLFGGVFVVGILAAIAIPKFSSVSKSAKQAEAAPILAYIQQLQTHHAVANGRYAPDLSGLTGYTDPEARYFAFSVSRAELNDLCIEAQPDGEGERAGLRATSMDGNGTHFGDAGCTGAALDRSGKPVEDISDSEASPTLKRLHVLETQFRKEEGRYALDLAELRGADSMDNRFFTFAVTRATDRELCVEARLTPAGRAAGLTESSMDHTGAHYLGLGCSGVRTRTSAPDEAVNAK